MKIKQSTFTIVANGFADGPAQPLRDYLVAKRAKRVTMINHPLVAEGSNKHIVTVYENGKQTSQKKYALPNKPPYTFVLDPFVPLTHDETTAWFGFNNLACLKGLMQKRRGKAEKVYYWAVDFVPNRFGSGLMTKAYNKADKKVCIEADGRIELAQTALEKRPVYLGLSEVELAPASVAPMGTWLERTPKATPSSWKNKKVVYLGHLVERQGVATLIKALGEVIKKDLTVKAEIVGAGPELDNLKKLASRLGISENVIFHGFVESHEEVETILAGGTVAAATYLKDKESFTQFADPGKLKAYLGASLPIVLTDVPPNARELEAAGAAFVVKDDPKAVAKSLEELLTDKAKWTKAHNSAAKLAQQYDWNYIMGNTLKQLGFD